MSTRIHLHDSGVQSSATVVAERIRDAISQGEITPGERLHQEDLAERFGVSRSPVREALRLLEARGLITYRANKGAVVSGISTADVDEMFAIRRLLEVDLMRRAAAKCDVQTIAHARRILSALKHETDAGTWIALHWTFHRGLYAPAERPRTLDVVYEQHVRISNSSSAKEVVAATKHLFERHDDELLQSLEIGDVEGALRATCEHLDEACARITVAMKDVLR